MPDHVQETPSESSTYVFVVKIWLEANNKDAKWRGHITDVLSGDRRYFEDLFEVTNYMYAYLTKMDVRINWFWLLVRWIKRLKR